RNLLSHRRRPSQLPEVGLDHVGPAPFHGVSPDARAVRPGQDEVEVDERLPVPDRDVPQTRADLHVPGGDLPVLPGFRVEVADRRLLQPADDLERPGLHAQLPHGLVQPFQEVLTPGEAHERSLPVLRWIGLHSRSAPALAPGRNELSNRREASATCSTAWSNAVVLAFEGERYPLTFRTNWRAAAWISSSVAGWSGRRRVLMLLHMPPG